MYVTLWSDPLTEVTCDGGCDVAETEKPFTLLQDTVPSEWFWSCYFKVKLHNVALKNKTFQLSVSAVIQMA